jgi:hypothetical protein
LSTYIALQRDAGELLKKVRRAGVAKIAKAAGLEPADWEFESPHRTMQLYANRQSGEAQTFVLIGSIPVGRTRFGELGERLKPPHR